MIDRVRTVNGIDVAAPRRAKEPSDLLRFLDNASLHLIIMPTEQCNFRCVYCYEDFVHQSMTPEVTSAIKQFIHRRAPSLRFLSIEWYGGEPLLEFEIVQQIQSYAWNLTGQFPALAIGGTLVTNGSLLTRKRLDHLVAVGVRSFQISLDGDVEGHNTTRKSRSGTGTFTRIWKNLVAIFESKHEFEICLRLHMTTRNSDSLSTLLRKCHEAFGHDKRWHVTLQAVKHLGGPNDSEFPVLESPAVQGAKTETLRKLCADLGITSQKNPFNGRDHSPGCYAAAANSFVIRSNGDLAKCGVALRDPRNRVGKLNRDGTLDIEPAKMSLWLRGLLSGNEAELRCPNLKLPSLPGSGSRLPIVS